MYFIGHYVSLLDLHEGIFQCQVSNVIYDDLVHVNNIGSISQ